MKQLFSDIEKTSSRGPWSLREEKLTRLWSRLAIWCVMCREEGKWKTAVLQGLEHRPVGPSLQDAGNVQSRVTERKKLAGKASDPTGSPGVFRYKLSIGTQGKTPWCQTKSDCWGQNNDQRVMSEQPPEFTGVGESQAPNSPVGRSVALSRDILALERQPPGPAPTECKSKSH